MGFISSVVMQVAFTAVAMGALKRQGAIQCVSAAVLERLSCTGRPDAHQQTISAQGQPQRHQERDGPVPLLQRGEHSVWASRTEADVAARLDRPLAAASRNACRRVRAATLLHPTMPDGLTPLPCCCRS